jgi:hypothetical protein
LGAGVKHLEHAHAGAVVDGDELVEPAARSGNALEELDVDLQAMARPGFFVPLPSLPMGAVFLIRGKARQAMSHQDAVDRGHRSTQRRGRSVRDPVVRQTSRPEGPSQLGSRTQARSLSQRTPLL